MNEDAGITAEMLHTYVKADNPCTRKLAVISEEVGYLLTLIGEEDSIRAEAEELIANELAQPQGRRHLKIVWL